MTNLLTKIIADFSTTLTTKTAIGATTATLTSGLDADGIQLPTGTYGFTIDRNNANKEYFTATLTGSNLTNIKTVTRGTGVGTSGLVKTHRKGAEVIISDWVAVKRMLDLLDGTTSFDATTPLGYDGTTTISTDNQFATKAYADGVAIAGGADSSTTVKGIGIVSVAPVNAIIPIFVGDNDGRVPTQSENDALVGTSGTPSSSNKYVTNADTSGTGSVARTSLLSFSSFGNGDDGTLTYDGSTTILGMAPVANIYTLTRDIYGTTITINNGVTIETAGYRIFASTLLTNNGTIKRTPNNGGNASGTTAGTGGAALADGTLYGGLAGQDGGSGALYGSTGSGTLPGNSGSNGVSNTSGISVSGVAGGTGVPGANGGAAGTTTLSKQGIKSVVFATSMFDFTSGVKVSSSASSGGGGAGGYIGPTGAISTGSGGGSGSSGAIVWISAKTLTNSGIISANGGNGGNGSASSGVGAGGGGGGAGGSGGVVVLIYNTITLGTVSVAGGTGGTGGVGNIGNGSSGSNGNTGVIIQLTA